jgi:N-succinyldiaminopimelate aminotransferase
MNPALSRLQPYPFEKLRLLLAGVKPNASLKAVNLSIGEPKHAAPQLLRDSLAASFDGLSAYPGTAGLPELRGAIADWLRRRYSLSSPSAIDADSEVLPVLGSREALFAFAQSVIDASRPARVVCPNPFYQIYEGAALLAGATPVYLNTDAASGYRMRFDSLGEREWSEVQLVYVCSPGNPSGGVMTLDDWRQLFALSDRHGFAIASDECYSELYFDEAKPPLGGLEAAQRLGRKGYPRLVMFSSLSKRSNAPGLRSGFVAGDAALLKSFLLYRTYHGSAMSVMVQKASIALWRDEAHVRENRRLYAEKFRTLTPLLAPLGAYLPDGGFYYWLRTPIDDTEFVRRLQAEYNVLVLPGSYLARVAQGSNPGTNHVRVALVEPLELCVEGAERISQFAARL